MDKEKRVIPLKEGLFKIPSSPSESPHLIGSRCRNCGSFFFPTRGVCLNCGKCDLEEVALSTKGKLDTFTIVWQVPPGAVVTTPYAIGRILLPEGVYVGSLVGDGDLQRLNVGMDMELVLEKVKEDEEGNEVVAFKFKPVV